MGTLAEVQHARRRVGGLDTHTNPSKEQSSENVDAATVKRAVDGINDGLSHSRGLARTNEPGGHKNNLLSDGLGLAAVLNLFKLNSQRVLATSASYSDTVSRSDAIADIGAVDSHNECHVLGRQISLGVGEERLK